MRPVSPTHGSPPDVRNYTVPPHLIPNLTPPCRLPDIRLTSQPTNPAHRRSPSLRPPVQSSPAHSSIVILSTSFCQSAAPRPTSPAHKTPIYHTPTPPSNPKRKIQINFAPRSIWRSLCQITRDLCFHDMFCAFGYRRRPHAVRMLRQMTA
jgi:hypothetical protein